MSKNSEVWLIAGFTALLLMAAVASSINPTSPYNSHNPSNSLYINTTVNAAYGTVQINGSYVAAGTQINVVKATVFPNYADNWPSSPGWTYLNWKSLNNTVYYPNGTSITCYSPNNATMYCNLNVTDLTFPITVINNYTICQTVPNSCALPYAWGCPIATSDINAGCIPKYANGTIYGN
jgi:hypothetical protein